MIKQTKHTYSDGITNETIVLLGSYPPPLGGISVHVQRVEQKLRAQNNSVHVFVTTKRRSFFSHLKLLVRFLRRHKPDRIYYHSFFLGGGVIEFPLIIFCARMVGSQLITIDHVSRFFCDKEWWYKRYISVLFSLVDQQVLIGVSTYRSYLTNGIFFGKDALIEDAFLPPDTTKESSITFSYPDDLWSFFAQHSPIIIANASKTAIWNGVDLYGLDMCLELLASLKKDKPSIGMIIALSSVGDRDYFEQLLPQLKAEKNIYLLFECQAQLWPLFKRADLMVRPTASDGASVSIAEALYVGTPVVASDVCTRPQDAVLFKNRDTFDFIKKVTAILEMNRHEPSEKQRNTMHAQSSR